MIVLAAAPSTSASAAVVVAGLLMVVAGVSKKRVTWRGADCQVCHHPRGSCTCRWL